MKKKSRKSCMVIAIALIAGFGAFWPFYRLAFGTIVRFWWRNRGLSGYWGRSIAFTARALIPLNRDRRTCGIAVLEHDSATLGA